MSTSRGLNYSHDAMNAFERAIKRVVDFTSALIGLILLSPAFLLIAILLKRQKNGKVIFKQERIGYGGEPFTIYKFRTMSSIVEDEGPQLVAKPDKSSSTKLESYYYHNYGMY